MQSKRIVFGVTPVSGSSVPFQSAPPWLPCGWKWMEFPLICCSTLQRQAFFSFRVEFGTDCRN